MKAEELKMGNKYKFPKLKNNFIYIGYNQDEENYIFLFQVNKSKYDNYEDLRVSKLKRCNIDTNQIIKKLKLEKYIDIDGFEKIRDYDYIEFSKKTISQVKPLLKDKLNNIINR